MSTRTPVPERLGLFDYYQILVSVLLVFLGAWILLREVFSGRVVLMAWFLGGSLLLYGLYRMKHVLDYFRKKR
ncbi:MAG: hypothetical protein HY347_09920 [candidate division NC10 bacterium]|nr:hypothetical protein [candidate division NC10 bacterium]